jgi:hypothetical protein
VRLTFGCAQNPDCDGPLDSRGRARLHEAQYVERRGQMLLLQLADSTALDAVAAWLIAMPAP